MQLLWGRRRKITGSLQRSLWSHGSHQLPRSVCWRATRSHSTLLTFTSRSPPLLGLAGFHLGRAAHVLCRHATFLKSEVHFSISFVRFCAFFLLFPLLCLSSMCDRYSGDLFLYNANCPATDAIHVLDMKSLSALILYSFSTLWVKAIDFHILTISKYCTQIGANAHMKSPWKEPFLKMINNILVYVSSNNTYTQLTLH